jgi:hypothetical protein
VSPSESTRSARYIAVDRHRDHQAALAEARRYPDYLQSQARAVGAEIIVADGHGKGLPDDVADWYPYVIWLKKVGGAGQLAPPRTAGLLSRRRLSRRSREESTTISLGK